MWPAILLATILWTALPSISTAASAKASTIAEELIVAPGDAIEIDAPADAQAEAAWAGRVMEPVDGDFWTAPESGDHWLVVASRDELGRLSPARWTWVRVDNVAPELILKVDPEAVEYDGARWVPGGAHVEARARDDKAGLASLNITADDGETQSESSPLRFALPTDDGPTRIRASAEDRVGHRSDESLNLQVDATAPDGEVVVEGPHHVLGDLTVLSPNVELAARLEDFGSGVDSWTAQIDGAAQENLDVLEGWEHGETRNIEIHATDRVGNLGRTAAQRFVVDREAPEIVWEIVDEGVENAGILWYRAPVTIELGATDEPAGVELLQANDMEIAGRRQFEGESVRFFARDQVGNEGTETAEWRVDADPPTIRLTDAEGETIYEPGTPVRLPRGVKLRLKVDDAGVGLESAVYVVGDSLPKPVTPLISFPDQGEAELRVEAVDRFGRRTEAVWKVVLSREGATP